MKKIVFFTGSGISQPSGIETFRNNINGPSLWLNNKVEDVAMLSGFLKNPKLVHDFYNNLRKNIKLAEPNIAHKLISQLENDYEITVITQNIDDLHERAGSSNVLHLHGNYNKLLCMNCHHSFIHNQDWSEQDSCNKCQSKFDKVRPSIVWFYENLDPEIFEKAEEYCRQADLFVQIGTSASVYPAANLIKRVKIRRKKVEINLVKSMPRRPYTFHNYYLGNIIHSFPEFIKDISFLLELNEKGIFKNFKS